LAAIPVGFGVLGLPWLRANLIIDDEGITQQIFQTRSAKWADIISWQRTNSGKDGPDTITIVTRSGSFTLNHNLVFGERVDFIDAELRRRRVPIAGFTERKLAWNGPSGLGRNLGMVSQGVALGWHEVASLALGMLAELELCGPYLSAVKVNLDAAILPG
jgi:hypothetical protein